MGNGNSTSSKSKFHGHTSKAGSTEPQYVPRQGKPSTKDNVDGFPPYGTKSAAFRGEYIDKPKVERQQQGLGVYSEQHGKKSLDNDDTFTEYIRRAKQRIRTVSNIGREHSNPAPAAAPEYVDNGTNNKEENQSDQFSEFIQLAKKKLKTTSRVGKNGSFKRG